MESNRLHPAVGAGAAHVHGILAGQRSKLVGGRDRLDPELLRLVTGTRGDDPGLDGRTEAGLVGGADLLGARLAGVAGEDSQGEHRPDDVSGVLLGLDAPLLFNQFQPLVGGHAETLGHGVNLCRDVGGGDGDSRLAAGLLDQGPVDERLERGCAVACQALGRQVIGGDLHAVDQGQRPGSSGRRGHRFGPGGRGIGGGATGPGAPHKREGDDQRRRHDLSNKSRPVDGSGTHGALLVWGK